MHEGGLFLAPWLHNMNESIRQSVQQQWEWYTQLPWLLLVILAIPLVLAARKCKIFPSIWWIVTLTVSLIASVLTVPFPSLLLVTLGIDFALIAVATFDFLVVFLNTNHGIEVKRSIAKTCSLGVPLPSEVTVENRTGITLRGFVRDDVPEHFTSSPTKHKLELPPPVSYTHLTLPTILLV